MSVNIVSEALPRMTSRARASASWGEAGELWIGILKSWWMLLVVWCTVLSWVSSWVVAARFWELISWLLFRGFSGRPRDESCSWLWTGRDPAVLMCGFNAWVTSVGTLPTDALL